MDHGKVRHHQDLRVWRVAIELAKNVYRLSEKMPPLERYGLTAQLQRAVVSIAANIAEGAARDSSRDFARFVAIAQGSLAELETHRVLASELHGVPHDPSVVAQIVALRRMLIRLRSVLIARSG